MIKMVCFDFDGVFTNGKIYEENGCINKYYDVKDGMGLALLRERGILTCMISNYKSKFQVKYNNSIIIEHLNFDVLSIGNTKKLDTLNEIILKHKLNWNNIAYIGDDINDIPVMTKVGFSACPNDATEECKNIVNHICVKNGGEGCVREFIDIILNKKLHNIIAPNIINNLKYNYNYILNNIDYTNIDILISNIENVNNIYCCGVGKSNNVAQHMVDIMKSINISAHILNCMNAIHGDIGSIKENDVVIFFSNSGNTPEILNIIDHIKVKKCKTILISCNSDNMIGNKCDITIILPKVDELEGIINCIPTNSIICMITYCNIVVSILSNKINNDIYISNHPAGTIGYNMKKIKDIIIKDFPLIILTDKVLLHDVLLEMTKYSIGCCFFINNKKLLGLMTDGDIRRMLLNNDTKKYITIDDININYYYETDINKNIYMVQKINRYKFIPIIENEIMIGIINIFNP
jgi:YrbI family 3-deoxy-D-manno-octulosonate 8-phosphate phosphatase